MLDTTKEMIENRYQENQLRYNNLAVVGRLAELNVALEEMVYVMENSKMKLYEARVILDVDVDGGRRRYGVTVGNIGSYKKPEGFVDSSEFFLKRLYAFLAQEGQHCKGLIRDWQSILVDAYMGTPDRAVIKEQYEDFVTYCSDKNKPFEAVKEEEDNDDKPTE